MLDRRRAFQKYFNGAINVTPDKNAEFTLDMKALQSFILFQLQSEIVEGTVDLSKSNDAGEIDEIARDLRRSMHNYCEYSSNTAENHSGTNSTHPGEAVRDFEYIEQWTDQRRHKPQDNPFQLRPSRHLERAILVRYELVQNVQPWSRDKDDPRLPGNQLRKKPDLGYLDWWWRLLITFTTVVLVVVPVFAITYVDTRLYNLLIASGFMVLVALVTLFAPIFRTRDALGITAAYISVLVLFVGAKIKI